MENSKRHLQKILNKPSGLQAFEATGEDLSLLVETLREAQQCRAARQFLLQMFRLDPMVSPAGFHRLLAIPEIDRVEIPNKMGDVDRLSRKAERQPESPVTAAEMNIVLQELNRDLVRIRDLKSAEFPNLLLAGEMTGDRLPSAAAAVESLRALNSTTLGYFFSPFKTKNIETMFNRLFPLSDKAHPLRDTLDLINRELDFYNRCAGLNQKWNPLCLDLFYIMQAEGLPQAIENVQRLGSSLWNVVYNGQRLKASLELVGIDFADVRTLFEENPAE